MTDNDMKMIEHIERTTIGHFKFLPEKLGLSVVSTHGTTIINCGLGSSMFNICYDSLDSDENTWSLYAQNIVSHFNGQPFAWWVPESKRSLKLSHFLESVGFIKETIEHAMVLELSAYHLTAPTTKLEIKQVATPANIEDFVSIISTYDQTACRFYRKLKNYDLTKEEKLFVGYRENLPVAISILFESAPAVGIFSLITKESERGNGYGTAIMHYLLNFSKNRGFKYATLLASSDGGYRIYNRLGFKKIGEFECFEWSNKRNNS